MPCTCASCVEIAFTNHNHQRHCVKSQKAVWPDWKLNRCRVVAQKSKPVTLFTRSCHAVRLCAPPPEPHTDLCPDLSCPGLPLRGARHIGLIVFWHSPLWLRACVRWVERTEWRGNNIHNCCRELESLCLYLAKCCETFWCDVVTAELTSVMYVWISRPQQDEANCWFLDIVQKKGRLNLMKKGRKYTVWSNALCLFVWMTVRCGKYVMRLQGWAATTTPSAVFFLHSLRDAGACSGRSWACFELCCQWGSSCDRSRGASGGVAFTREQQHSMQVDSIKPDQSTDLLCYRDCLHSDNDANAPIVGPHPKCLAQALR